MKVYEDPDYDQGVEDDIPFFTDDEEWFDEKQEEYDEQFI